MASLETADAPAGAPASASTSAPAPAAFEEGDMSPAANQARLEFLRERGVEVETNEERAALAAKKSAAAKRAAAAAEAGTAEAFTFVKLELDPAKEAQLLTGAVQPDGDVLTDLLAPYFADDAALDASTVERETASQLKNMMLGGLNQGKTMNAPSASTIGSLAAAGACEAYPLARGSEENGCVARGDWDPVVRVGVGVRVRVNRHPTTIPPTRRPDHHHTHKLGGRQALH